MKIKTEKIRNRLPSCCPSCSGMLEVTSMGCPRCGTSVQGNYPLPELLELSDTEMKFILDFIRSSGSLKDMSKNMGLSYPTVRNILDGIIEKLKK